MSADLFAPLQLGDPTVANPKVMASMVATCAQRGARTSLVVTEFAQSSLHRGLRPEALLGEEPIS